MAPLARTHVHVSTSDHLDSGSDSDAPEAVNTVQAKKGAKGRDDELKRFEAGERDRRRELNRKRDEVLKARAAGAVGPKHTRRAEGGGGKGLDEEEEEGEGRSAAVLEARMRRAMAAAEEEDDDSENDMDDMGDEDAGMEDDLMDDEDDEEEDLEEDLDLGGPSASHLPDHLFAALDRLPPPSASASASRMAKGKVASAPQSSRKRRRSRPKDIVLGTRTIRPLSAPRALGAPIAASRTLPTPKVDRFASTHLGLGLRAEPPSKAKWRARKVLGKGALGKTGSKPVSSSGSLVEHGGRWERRAANVGVLRTSGPAAHFARGSR